MSRLEPMELHAAKVEREAPIKKRVGEIYTVALELSELLHVIGMAAHHGEQVSGALDGSLRLVSCIEGLAEEIEADLMEAAKPPTPATPESAPVIVPKKRAKKVKVA